MSNEEMIHRILDSLAATFANSDRVVTPEEMEAGIVVGVETFASELKAAIPSYVKSWYERG